VTIASGVFSFNFPLFVLLAAITRGFRFFLIAFLLKKFGEPVQEFIERRLNLIGFAVLIALIAGFAAVAWL
jgi:membrane protein DedA with SNARE-associated domain